jgi:hypothetical protein
VANVTEERQSPLRAEHMEYTKPLATKMTLYMSDSTLKVKNQSECLDNNEKSTKP